MRMVVSPPTEGIPAGREALRASVPRRRLLAEGAWVAAGQVLSALGLVVGMRILTEFLPPDVFGTLSLLNGLVMFATSILCGSQLQAVLRFYPDLARKGQVHSLRTTMGRSLRRTTFGLAGLVLIAGVLCRFWISVSFWAFAGVACLLVVETFRTFETTLLTAARRQRPYSLWQAAEAWVRPLFAVAAVLLLGATPQAVILGYVIGTGIVLLAFTFVIPRDGEVDSPQPHDHDPALLRDIWRFALPLLPMAVVTWLCSLSDRYVIGGMLGMDAVGFYAAASALASRPFLIVGGIIETTLRPVYFDAVAHDNRPLEKKVFRLWFWVTAAGSVLGIVAFICFKDVVAGLLLAEKYRSGAALMPWIAAGNAALVMAYAAYGRLYAQKRTGTILFCRSLSAAVALLIMVAAIYYWHLLGAAIACALYFSCECAIALFVSSDRMRPAPIADSEPAIDIDLPDRASPVFAPLEMGHALDPECDGLGSMGQLRFQEEIPT